MSIKRKIFNSALNIVGNCYANIHVSGRSEINPQSIFNRRLMGTKEYPVIVNNSVVGNIKCSEGCRFYDCICQGEVEIGRFVTFAGPGVKVFGNINGIEIGSFTSIGAGTVIQDVATA